MDHKASGLAHFFDELHFLQARLKLLHDAEDAAQHPAIHEAYSSLKQVLEFLDVAELELLDREEALLDAQMAADQERRRYAHLFEYAPDAYLVTTLAGKILNANHAAVQLFNVPAKYLLEKVITLYIAPAERQAFRTFLHGLNSERTDHSQTLETVIEGRHVAVAVPVSVMVLSVYDEQGTTLRWTLRDISRRRNAELQEQHLNQTLASLIEASPLAIVVVNRDNLVTVWNHAAEVIMGWSANETLGHQPLHISEDLWREADQNFARLRNNPSYAPVETEAVRKDGSRFPARLSIAPLFDADGTFSGSITMIADITEEKEKAQRDEARRVKGQLREVRAEEQRRLARNLHDSAVQQLVGLQFQLAHQRRQARNAAQSTPDFDIISGGLEEVEGEIKGIIQLLRGVVSDLRPPGLEEYGLCRALEGYVAKLNRDRPYDILETRIDCPADDPPIPLALGTTLFRIVQEALMNIHRHAHARRADIVITYNDDALTMVIEDDGEGFIVPTSLSTFAYDEHFGLVGIAEGVELADGTFTIRSDNGQGTTLTVVIPLGERMGTAGTDGTDGNGGDM